MTGGSYTRLDQLRTLRSQSEGRFGHVRLQRTRAYLWPWLRETIAAALFFAAALLWVCFAGVVG